MPIKSALQTITWGDPQHESFPEIFACAAEAGFSGLEIGWRRLSLVSAPAMADLLAASGLCLVAGHVGGNLADAAQAAGERNLLDTVVDHLLELGTTRLLYSGLDIDDDAGLDAAIAMLADAAKRCADRGVALCYHNHDWEFARGRRVLDRLLAAAPTELRFAPDLGWAAKAGQDLGALLDELGDRLELLHFKDFATHEPVTDTVYLGKGIVDWSPVADRLDRWADRDFWLTAEQDTAEDAAAAARENGAFIGGFLADAGVTA